MSRRKKTHGGDLSATPEMAGSTTAGDPNPERVAQRAYELYLARGRADGHADEDWFRAERELAGGRTREGA